MWAILCGMPMDMCACTRRGPYTHHHRVFGALGCTQAEEKPVLHADGCDSFCSCWLLALPRRNLTISSATNDSSSYSRIDFDYSQSAADICSTCTVHFDHIAVANERRGTGGQVDFFTGRPPGALLLLTDVYRLRQGCIAPATAKQVTDTTPPSVRAAGLKPAQQLSRGPSNWRGEVKADQVQLFNWSTDFLVVNDEGGRKAGGYALVSAGRASCRGEG